MRSARDALSNSLLFQWVMVTYSDLRHCVHPWPLRELGVGGIWRRAERDTPGSPAHDSRGNSGLYRLANLAFHRNSVKRNWLASPCRILKFAVASRETSRSPQIFREQRARLKLQALGLLCCEGDLCGLTAADEAPGGGDEPLAVRATSFVNSKAFTHVLEYMAVSARPRERVRHALPLDSGGLDCFSRCRAHSASPSCGRVAGD